MTIHVMDNGSLVPLADIQYFDGEYHRIKEVWQWTGSEYVQIHLWVPPPFSPSGMTKNGSWVPTASTWTTIPGWSANAGSTVSGNGVMTNGAKTGAVISGQLSNIYTGGGYIEVDVRLLLDEVVVKTLTAVSVSAASPTVLITSDPLTVASGQVATMQIGGTYAPYATIQSGVNTYVRIT